MSPASDLVAATGPATTASNPTHPAWLQALRHYDPDYTYDLDRYEYSDWSTTDPYYIEDDVILAPSVEHGEFLTLAKNNLDYFLRLQGWDWPCVLQVVIRDLESLPATAAQFRARHRIEPDLALWPAGTAIHGRKSFSWPVDGAPLLVLEWLSDSTTDKDLSDNPDTYEAMGVQEYWIGDPYHQTPLKGYQRAENGLWVFHEVGDTATAWSPLLQTHVQNHPVQGFQCQHPATGEWLYFRQEGRREEKRRNLLNLACLLCDMDQYAAFVQELDRTPWSKWPEISDVYQRFQSASASESP